MTIINPSIDSIIESLPKLASQHGRTSDTYKTLDQSARSLVAASDFTHETAEAVKLGCFGSIISHLLKWVQFQH